MKISAFFLYTATLRNNGHLLEYLDNFQNLFQPLCLIVGLNINPMLQISLMHKNCQFITFEGFSTTFEASTNVFLLTILSYNNYVIVMITHALKLPAK